VRVGPPIATAAAALVAALAGPVGAAEGAEGSKSPRPNVVLIVTDDQTLASYSPEVMPKTAELLEGTGTRFSNAFVTSPLCCPSRASMLTGQYGHNNGVLRNEYGPLDAKGNTLPVWLQEAGYRTMHVGRYLNFYEPVTEEHEVAPGWDEWRTITGGSDYFDYELEVGDRTVRYGHEDADYVTRVINERAAHMIERYGPQEQPFFLQVDHIAPHQASGTRALGCKSSPIPDPRDRHRFRDLPLPVPPSLNEPDNSDKPSFVRSLPPMDEGDMRRATRRHRCSLASLRAVDRGVGRLFDSLERAGELAETAVFFVSDNGYYFGEHRIPDKKHNPYEEAIRVPLLIRLPKALRDGAPRQPVRDETVANIDIAPTILRLAKAAPCPPSAACRTLDGRSLVPLLQGRAGSWPNQRDLVIELARIGSPTDVGGRACAYSGIRTASPSGTSALYVEHTSAVAANGACEPVDERELYDLAADPWQESNLAYPGPAPGLLEEDHRSPLERSLAARLEELRDCAGLPGRDPRPDSGHYCE
jgi:arylsulfatase A-like enzyme